MKEKILKSLGYIFCAGLGLFTLILLATPYLTYVYGYTYNDSIVSSGPNNFSLNLSGYRAMDLWSLGVGGVMTSLLQIFVLILALLMLAWYFATALAKQYDDAIKFLESKSLSKWVYNKTIQKARESLRITKQQKAHLQTLKQ